MVPSPRVPAAGLAALVLTVLLTSSCAPSFRMVHRSRAYFERCYAADFDARIRRTERHACWVAWLDHYTAAQPRERILYAQERVAAQAGDTEALRLPGVETSAATTEAPTQSTDEDAGAADAPTADAASPRDAGSPPDAGSPSEARAAALTASPGAVPAARAPAAPIAPHRGTPACAPVCDPRFVACAARCDPTSPDACRDACAAEQRACGSACL